MVLRVKGLTLIELLVTLAVAAILITVGAPAMTSILERFRAQDAVSQWQGDLVYARQVAAAYQTSVTVCPMGGSPVVMVTGPAVTPRLSTRTAMAPSTPRMNHSINVARLTKRTTLIPLRRSSFALPRTASQRIQAH